MVGHILNDSMLPTTFFSLQVELASSHSLFASDPSKMIGWSLGLGTLCWHNFEHNSSLL